MEANEILVEHSGVLVSVLKDQLHRKSAESEARYRLTA
jgi:hypothetical protein